MLKTNHVTKTNKVNILATGILLLTSHFLFSTHAFANEIKDASIPVHTISKGAYKSKLNENIRKDIISAHKLSKFPDQLSNKATSMTREEMINNPKGRVNKSTKKLSAQSSNYLNSGNDYFADFAIYSAASFLEDDFDGDGFYQTFSVVFDADIYSHSVKQWGEVYALLYLSKNGGPWIHYYTTDDFIIDGESDSDEYEVITTFLSGYSTDYYDVLIDLYQVGYNDIVASYSADDNNALYALSLESADYDEPYLEPYVEVVEVHGGGFSIISLLILLTTGALRLRVKN